MSFTIQQQRDFIEKHFLKNNIVNHIPDRVDNNVDPFIPSQPPSLDVKTENTNTSYKYLDDLMLSNDLVLFPRNLLEEYKIHICPFSVNTKLETPFLQFMFSKNNSQYTFPVFDLDMKSIQDSSVSMNIDSNNEDDSDYEQEDNLSVNNNFLNQCISYFHDNILKKEDMDTDIKTKYRGYIEQDDTNNLYVFFDCTGLYIDVYNEKFKTNDYIFAIVDEINKSKINDVYIDNNIITLFQKNPFITELNTMHGEPTILPIISYMCIENKDNIYTNMYNDIDKNGIDENITDDILLIPPQINHPTYHGIYVFSTKALSGNYTNIKRFALFYEDFIQETENIDMLSEENEEEVEENEEEVEENEEEVEESDSDISIKEDEEEMEETENIDESSEEDEEEMEETENIDESSEEDEEETEENENIDVSSEEDEEEMEETENIDESSEEDEEEMEETENIDVSSEEDEEESDSDISSEEDMDVILEENVVFIFKNENEQSFYGTYSIETFIEI